QLAGGTGIQVKIHKQAEDVHADLGKLSRAVADLVDNALKFSPEGSAIEVRVMPAKIRCGEAHLPGVAFSVLDRGPGVPEEDVERIFAPFEQGGDTLTGKPRGFGIGLWEASSIARGHGGRLRYVPREGGGSEFRLVVPRIGLPIEPAETKGAPTPVAAADSRQEI
ncbi:MAG: ATP-binding protein, partial [Acidobacteriota bacterium]|nr:ATP-binding protein [Acidobacteriota bacterium]